MGFSIASFYGFKRYGNKGSKVKNQQKIKTEYSIKIADLSDISNLNISASLKRKIEKILKSPEYQQFSGTYELYINMNIKDALFKNFKSLRDLRAVFKTNEDCIKFLKELIWEGEPISPYDSTSKVYECKDGWYKCKNTGKEKSHWHKCSWKDRIKR